VAFLKTVFSPGTFGSELALLLECSVEFFLLILHPNESSRYRPFGDSKFDERYGTLVDVRFKEVFEVELDKLDVVLVVRMFSDGVSVRLFRVLTGETLDCLREWAGRLSW